VDFCKHCGAVIQDGSRFCSSCGARVPDYETTGSGGEYGNSNTNNDRGYVRQDAQNDKLLAILAYFGPLVFIPIFSSNGSPFVRFHANQGFTLFLAWVVSLVLDGIFWILGWLLGVAVFVMAILGIIGAAQGRERELPLFGHLRLVDQWFKNI